jgi:hypothetical protein
MADLGGSVWSFPSRLDDYPSIGIEIERVLCPSLLVVDFTFNHMAAFQAFVGSEFWKRSQFRCNSLKHHDGAALRTVLLVAFLNEHRLSSSRSWPTDDFKGVHTFL